MSEREEPGIAEQKIEPERRNGGNQSIGKELDLIKPDEMRKQSQKRQNHDGCNEQQQFGAVAGRARLGAHHALPNSPVGLTRSTIAAMR
jgi:hypothetical protein